MRSSRSLSLAVFFLFALAPGQAHAQFYGAAYLGGNYTNAADISISQPEAGTSLVIHDVTFSAKPLQSPQYYGVRLGRLFRRCECGAELEFIHLKVISNTSASYAASGEVAGVPVAETVQMDSIVERYSMTHGLNYLVINAIIRHRVGQGPVAFIARAGVGPTYPHAESSVLGIERQQYEYAGVGVHAAAGVDLKLKGRLSTTVEYKLTGARPEITIAGGTGRVRTITHQVAAGLAFGLSR